MWWGQYPCGMILKTFTYLPPPNSNKKIPRTPLPARSSYDRMTTIFFIFFFVIRNRYLPVTFTFSELPVTGNNGPKGSKKNHVSTADDHQVVFVAFLDLSMLLQPDCKQRNKTILFFSFFFLNNVHLLRPSIIYVQAFR